MLLIIICYCQHACDVLTEPIQYERGDAAKDGHYLSVRALQA